MTLAVETSRNDYTGDGGTTSFAYSFKIFQDADLLVTVRDYTSGVETTQTLTTHYTVTGAGETAGGTVDFVTAPALNDIVTIRRVRDITQQMDIRNQGPFYQEALENNADHLCMLDQQQQDEIDRCIKLPETEAGTTAATVVPQVADRANCVLGFDASGNISMVQSGYSFYLYTVSPYMANVIQAASGAAALTLLGVSSYAQTLLDDATYADAQTTLGITPFAQTILDDATGPDVLNTLGYSSFMSSIVSSATIADLHTAIDVHPPTTYYSQSSGTSILVSGVTTLLSGCSFTVSSTGDYEIHFDTAFLIPATGNVSYTLYLGGTPYAQRGPYYNNTGVALCGNVSITSIQTVTAGVTVSVMYLSSVPAAETYARCLYAQEVTP